MSELLADGTVEVPRTLEQALDPAWLTTALGRRFPGVRVTRAVPGPVVERVSTNARFRIECEGTWPEGLPRDLCVKGYFSEYGHLSRRAGLPEALFYLELAGTAGVRTLQCAYADVDPDTQHGVVITHDVAAAGETFLDALSPYTPAQATESLEQYAILHGRSWCAATIRDAPWLASRLAHTLQARGLREISGNFDGPIGAGVPDAVRDPERLVATFERLAAIARRAEPWCLLHGDAHVGNLFVDPRGRPSLLDWQLVQRGPWYLDVGYHIGSVLNVEDRRRYEDELLAAYLDRLGRQGVAVPSWSSAQTAICAGLVYGFFLWGITLKVAPPVTAAMLVRLGTAVADHHAFDVVDGMEGVDEMGVP
jgi:hypothetical protein